MGKIITLKPRGIIKDIPASELALDVFSDGNNVVCDDDFVTSAPGYEQIFGTPLYAPKFLLSSIRPAENYWLYAGNSGVGVTNGVNHYDLTPVGGITASDVNDWTGGTLNSLPFLNNLNQVPMYWDGNTSNDLADLPGWSANDLCGAMRSFKYNLIAMDIDENGSIYSDMVKWSAAASPGAVPSSWTPDVTNDAGSNLLSSTKGGIVDGLALRDVFLIYKQHATHIMQYVGGNYVFGFRKLFTTSGVLSRNCIAEIKGYHIVLTDGDVIMTDGQSIKSIVDRKWKKYLFNSIDPSNYKGCYVVADAGNDRVLICYPETGSTYANKALVYDLNSEKIGIMDLPNVPFIASGLVEATSAVISWSSDSEAWEDDSSAWNERSYNPTSDSLLMSDVTNTKLYQLGAVNQFNGADINNYMAKESMDFDDPESVKLVTRVLPKLTGPIGTVVQIRIGTQFDEGESISWSSVFNFTIGVDRSVDLFEAGRLISLYISSSTTNKWYFNSADIEYDIQGYW